MKLSEFLALLVPPGVMVGAKLVAGLSHNTVSHSTAKLHGDLATQLKASDATSHNAYFALAAYKQGYHNSPKQTNADGTPKRVLRVRENVDSLKALWFDIDFKPDPKTGVTLYPNLNVAGTALKVFCQAASMPVPSLIVGTGNGMHVYWPLDVPVPLDRWQRLADALKVAAQEKSLAADLVCTADACRILRPIETHNWKDPANPKPVRVLFSNGRTFTYQELEASLQPWIGAAPKLNGHHSPGLNGHGSELTGGMGLRSEPSRFEVVIKNCGVLRAVAESHGKSCREPEWVAALQLLKHCEDAAMWVHPISDGHPGYSQAETERKWQYRMANSAGPSLCSTFEIYQSSTCAKCPHKGFVKTPLQLGYQDSQPLEGLPTGWRVAPQRHGIERLQIDATNGTKEWVRLLRHVPTNLRVTRSILTHRYDMSLQMEIRGSKPETINLPGGMLGNMHRLNETLAEYGCALKQGELKSFGDLMATWLEQLQAARRVADVTEQLGWLTEKHPDGEKIIGFSCGPATFYSDGRVRNDVCAAREFSSISKFYEPKGSLDQWKKVAAFLADQNKSAFTAIVAAAFGTPLLRFTGLSGGILSIVSTASGVGKSSALKCSQAVWGSPTHGVNAVDDTPKSVARKLGFLNNLPAYWDELRGRKTVDDFLTLAFQITQGKEKTRLDSSAQLREVSTWETMLIVASNESIFEAMARHGGGSDAGLVRTFEMVVEPFSTDQNRAQVSLLFETLNSNFGHAGRVYAQFLATHATDVEKRVQDKFTKMAQGANMAAQERFWFGIVAIIIVGAEIASELDLIKIDVREMSRFLLSTIYRLRGRSVDAMTTSQPAEILASFMGAYQDRALVVDRFPKPKANLKTYLPDMSGGMPKSDKIVYHVSRDENLLRMPRSELERWLEYRELPVYNILKRFKDELGAKEIRTQLGIGTKWALPQQKLLEFDLSKFGLTAASVIAAPAAPDVPGNTAVLPP